MHQPVEPQVTRIDEQEEQLTIDRLDATLSSTLTLSDSEAVSLAVAQSPE